MIKLLTWLDIVESHYLYHIAPYQNKWLTFCFFSADDLISNLSFMWVYFISRTYIMNLYLLIQWWLGNAAVGFSAVNFVNESAKCGESLVRMWTTIIESCLIACPGTYSVTNMYINYLVQRFRSKNWRIKCIAYIYYFG